MDPRGWPQLLGVDTCPPVAAWGTQQVPDQSRSGVACYWVFSNPPLPHPHQSWTFEVFKPSTCSRKSRLDQETQGAERMGRACSRLRPSSHPAGTWPPQICRTAPGGPVWVKGPHEPRPQRALPRPHIRLPPLAPRPSAHLASHLLDLVSVEYEAPPHELVAGGAMARAHRALLCPAPGRPGRPTPHLARRRAPIHS